MSNEVYWGDDSSRGGTCHGDGEQHCCCDLPKDCEASE